MVKNLQISKNKFIITASIAVISFLVATLALTESVNAYYSKRIYPKIFVNNVLVGAKTKDEALELLSTKIEKPQFINLNFYGETIQNFKIETSTIDFKYSHEKTVDQAFSIGRSKNRIFNLLNIINMSNKPVNLTPSYEFDEKQLEEDLSVIAGQVAVEPIYPSAKLTNGQLVIEQGNEGQDINIAFIKNEINKRFIQNSTQSIDVNVREINPALTEKELTDFRLYAEKLIGKKLKIQYEEKNLEVLDNEIISMLRPHAGTITIDKDLLSQKIDSISSTFNREPQNSVFVFEESIVKEFAPAKDGLEVDREAMSSLFISTLLNMGYQEEKEINIAPVVSTTSPAISTSDVNNLGIKELIGRGTSKYKGSISSRVYNIALATSRVNGTLIKPGETFSFNGTVGDVSQLTGYKQAYVIKDGKTVLGDGGGLCQVSTTVFRAALNAGLPISERRGHSYRVGYYEQDAGPGLDATVYSPTTDFKFVNDTPGHILVQASADTKNMTLTFELYGTSDGRVVNMTKPVMTNVSAPPEDLYQDDPTLPAGVVRQVEHKAWGGKSTFSYEVKRGDEVIYQKHFVTNYRPWQAVYLRGTGPAQ